MLLGFTEFRHSPIHLDGTALFVRDDELVPRKLEFPRHRVAIIQVHADGFTLNKVLSSNVPLQPLHAERHVSGKGAVALELDSIGTVDLSPFSDELIFRRLVATEDEN